VGKLIQGLLAPDSGLILLGGQDGIAMPRRTRARCVQMIFQDPYSSLNPKISVGAMLKEALNLSENPQTPQELLSSVGLPEDILNDYPHQFSGGQRQRLGIARALAARPKLMIADEPVSALDVTIQAQILKLLLSLKDARKMSYLFITHDLSIVEAFADRMLVMKEGALVESGKTEEIFRRPREPYTQSLLAAIPRITI
jgi:ABC-type dipeptide/oligopeptide/nickel transport system ATPase subunit